MRFERFLVNSFGFLALVIYPPDLAVAEPSAKALSPWSYDASLRTRYENVNWFGTPESNDDYSFWHTKLRVGVGYSIDTVRFYTEGQYTQLYSLPEGGVGPGSVYFSANESESSPGEVAFRQAYLAKKTDQIEIVAGRFLYSSGSESLPKNPVLASLRTSRVTQRMIGPFDFTSGRSFDGVRAAVATDVGSFFTVGMMPTEGGFRADQNSTITDIKIGAVSWTAPISARVDAQDDLQVFAYYYGDDRGVVKTDDRPADARTLDLEDIRIGTIGGNWAHLLQDDDIKITSLVWAGGQLGDWGSEDHRAWAFTAELAARAEVSSVKPGIRLGYTVGSGDSDPSDSTHQTFFQMVPTVRAFAATPLYNMQNISDFFLDLSVQPCTDLAVRGGAHWLQLTESQDLLYSGGGANEKRDRFGYAGLASGGSHDVGTLLDVEASWTISPHVSATAYYGHLIGGEVINAAVGDGGDDIDYFFAELNLKL